MMINKEKDIKTDTSITMNEDNDLQHLLPRSGMTNTRQSSTLQEAVARSVEVPTINFNEFILTELNSGICALTASTHDDVTTNKNNCNKMMNEKDEMMESTSATMPATPVCSPQIKSGDYEIDGETVHSTIDKDPDDDEVTTEDTFLIQPSTGRHLSKGVIYIVPIRMMKSAEITQKEYDKFYETSHRISIEQLKQNLP